MKRALLAVCSIAALSAPVFAQDGPPRVSEIATSGRGEVRIPPTRAIVAFNVDNFARNAAVAASDNARTSQATIAALKSVGVKDTDISNGGYSVYPDFEKGKPRGFNARNIIRVEVPIADVGKVVDTALEVGATSVSPIQFMGGDLAVVRRDALKRAVAEARRDAEALADAAGGSLGRLLSLTSGVSQPIGRGPEFAVTAALSSSGGYTPTDLRPSDLTVTAVASGRWEFLPRR
jgi:uncharacterized protein